VGVEANDFTLVFDVVEDDALAVDGGELGLAGEGDGGDDFPCGSVDDGGILAAGSKTMPSGFWPPVGMVATVARVARSKTTTALPPPSEM
jgi:hypothetical protein